MDDGNDGDDNRIEVDKANVGKNKYIKKNRKKRLCKSLSGTMISLEIMLYI